MTPLTGGCQCGRVRYNARLESFDGYLCHCNFCRRATGGVSIAFVSLPQADVTWDREPDWYQSSPIARRPFCSACGTPLGFAFFDSPNMDLTVGSFDDPSPFRPTSHSSAETILEAWLDTSHLPRHRLDTYTGTVDRWTKTDGGMPNAGVVTPRPGK